MSNGYISVSDSGIFATIDETFEKIFSSKNPQPMKGYFEPLPSFTGTELAGHHIWFPKFAKTESGNFIPATDIALNQISGDGKEIVEILPEETVCEIGDKKITFAKFGNNEPYKFIGIFEVEKKKKENRISFNKKISDKCLKIKGTDNTSFVKALSMLFFLLLLVCPNIVSCSSSQSDVYGTYELVKKDIEYQEHWNNLPITAIYKAITIDSDSMFVFNIGQCDFSSETFSTSCGDTKDYSKVDLNVAKKELDTLTMVHEITKRYRITAYEPFENQDMSTKGSYPNGYIISGEGEYVSMNGKSSVIVQIIILKHIKDKGRVLIVPTNSSNAAILDIPSKVMEVNNKLPQTGNAAKKNISKLLENYKKTLKDKGIVKKLMDKAVKGMAILEKMNELNPAVVRGLGFASVNG
jgi:hypothetical protein